MKVEEIPPLDIFYDPTDKDIVKRQRKKIKSYVSATTSFESEPMEIVWRDISMDPSNNLTKLSQYAGAYATAMIDKATNVQLLLKERKKELNYLNNNLSKKGKALISRHKYNWHNFNKILSK